MVRSLINRFKEFRRPRKPRKLKAESESPRIVKLKTPGITNSVIKPIPPPGEDPLSYERHIKALQVEFKKTNRNKIVIGEKNVLSLFRDS